MNTPTMLPAATCEHLIDLVLTLTDGAANDDIRAVVALAESLPMPYREKLRDAVTVAVEAARLCVAAAAVDLTVAALDHLTEQPARSGADHA